MENIAKYRIEEKIGVGGFGEVFRGYDPFIKRHVAVKTCLTEDPEIRDRFFREAEIAGNLHHRNITTVYDFGVHEGLPYLIQEYLSGEDLDAKIKRRDFLPYPEKLFYLLQVARGLAHAHSKGVIHRDIKPANIRILEDGTAKIMDFGIARLAQQESGLTKTGMTVGTAAYLAPEQVRGAPVDLRTDIFSFGVMAYELLTGERPFQGQQISTVIYQLLNHEPKPIPDVWPEAPPDMVAVVERCLRKEAGERFADGRELVRELEAVQKRGRSAPEAAANQPTVAGEPAKTGNRQVGLSTAAAPGPLPAAAAEPGSVTPDLEYSLPSAESPATEPKVAPAAAKPRFSTAGTLVILLLLAIVAAAAGWWFGMREAVPPPLLAMEEAPQPVPDLRVETPSTSPPGVTPPPAAGPRTEPRATTLPETPPESPLEETPPTAEDAPGDVVPSAAPGTAETAPPPPPPAAPRTGRIEVPAVTWTEYMTLSLNGKTYPLWRSHDIVLPAGTYKAVFALVTDTYSPSERKTTVVVEAGGSQQLAIPIPPPGALSVRPMVGRPQGKVFLDGEAMGSTLSKVRREPGSYTVEIRPRSGDGQPLSETVILEPGVEIILSFDLTAATVTSRTKELSP